MDEHMDEYSVAKMCKVLEVSRSGFYDWKQRPLTDEWQKRQEARDALKQDISVLYHQNYGVYGSPRIHKDLLEIGHQVSESHVAALMREMGLSAEFHKMFVTTTDSDHDKFIYPNLLNRQFDVKEINKVWVTDITYIRTSDGWLYLASVMDLYSRRIVGYTIGVSMEVELVLTALKKALILRQPPDGFLHHSDRGSQYCSNEYIQLLEERNVQISMSRKGDPYDNACIESFHATIKKELIYRWGQITRKQAIKEIRKYIDGFYNPTRRHSRLDYLSPIQFEEQGAKQKQALVS
ncbi:IS3 family transposase [Sporosarcina thermotolerans]|uniref:IS3 family transposase n=1 Tax=Sporosarcina thermotolerans TaxID=633404 RepID=A0AAW9ABN9_9BACL|nr:IS3 family transposase [Sporosarcina thermotolerans]MDW0118832.1 IS3 family transposase [Sporosarcina thermotolerans]WHT49830.1 IS3 family transposase [Sporosarcina thermotolerans]